MASGSQTYRGICADLPRSADQQQQADGGENAAAGLDRHALRALPKHVGEIERSELADRSGTIASEKPKSPMRFTMNALLPALVANCSVK